MDSTLARTADGIGECLRTAASRWATVRAVMLHRRRHDLVSIGFERHFAALEAAGGGWGVSSVSATAVDAALADRSEIEAVLSVAADRCRRRVEALSRHGDEWLPDLMVVDGDTWWARTGHDVVSNHGDIHQQHGGTDDLRLLIPTRVPDGFELTVTPEVDVVAGRRCTLVLATARPREPTQPGPPTPGAELFAMIAGGDRFRLSVDDQTGVLLRVVKEVDGLDAETVEFIDVAFDVSLPPRLFDAPT